MLNLAAAKVNKMNFGQNGTFNINYVIKWFHNIQLILVSDNFFDDGIWFANCYLWDSSLKHIVSHMEGRRVHCGDNNHSNILMRQRRVFGKMEGDVDPTMIKQCNWLKVT